MDTIRPNWNVLFVCLALTAALTALAAGLSAGLSTPEHPPARPTSIVHAEQSGIRLGTNALTGRVALVAAESGLRWRIAGVTEWQRAAGRVLAKNWNTTELADGPYRLELEGRAGLLTQPLFVRNYTRMPDSPLANASAGLDTRSTDGDAVVGVFGRRSYEAGDSAVLRLKGRYPAVLVELIHVGPERQLTIGNQTMEGVRVAGPFLVKGTHSSVRLRIGAWASGVYAARMTAPGRVGFAPFIVRPAVLGRNRVAVVQPTNTWQAYNYRDANGDGRADTWYADSSVSTVDMSRPFLDRGVPPHFRQYDVTYLRWLAHTGKHVDMLSEEDLERIPGARLAQLYRLIVFPGHHEYVTEAEYNAVQRYRDLGGNLAFLSANNFFSRVDRHGDKITRIGRWRDLGRPESALVGVQYFAWNRGWDCVQYEVVGAHREPWLFAGTHVADGDRLGQFGIEADGRTAASPRAINVLAVIPNAFGTGHTAEMTYYETAAGAKVFAAGAFTLSGTQARTPAIWRILDNLWARLTVEDAG